jgi:hypothetical protein
VAAKHECPYYACQTGRVSLLCVPNGTSCFLFVSAGAQSVKVDLTVGITALGLLLARAGQVYTTAQLERQRIQDLMTKSNGI